MSRSSQERYAAIMSHFDPNGIERLCTAEFLSEAGGSRRAWDEVLRFSIDSRCQPVPRPRHGDLPARRPPAQGRPDVDGPRVGGSLTAARSRGSRVRRPDFREAQAVPRRNKMAAQAAGAAARPSRAPGYEGKEGIRDSGRRLVSGRATSLIEDVLRDPGTRGRGWFDGSEIDRLLDAHLTGSDDHTPRLWNLAGSNYGSASGSMGADGDRLPRVLFVIGSLEAGGSESQARRVARANSRLPGEGNPRRARLRPGPAPHRPGQDGRGPAGDPRAPAQPRRTTRRRSAALRGPGPLGSAGSRLSLARAVDLARRPLARLLGVPVLVARRNVSGPYAELPRPIVSAMHAAERLAVLATANSSAVAGDRAPRHSIPADTGDRQRLRPGVESAITA